MLIQQTPVSGALPVHPIRLGNVACPVSRLISKFERKKFCRPVLKQSESQTLATSLAPAVYPFHNPVPNTTSTHLGVVRKACLPTTEPEVTATGSGRDIANGVSSLLKPLSPSSLVEIT